MTAKDVIDAWVAEVAMKLPRKQRNDVAFELRALVEEGMQDKADAAGRPVDAALALEVVRAMGRPADVAARYRPALVVIDPADGRAFLQATLVGLGLIWFAGALVAFSTPGAHPGGWLGALGQWWGTAVVPSLWWPGALGMGFAVSAWLRRRWPQTQAWTPRPQDRSPGGRVGLVLGLVGMVLGLAALFEPRWVLDVVFGGRAHESAYAALTYTDAFRQRQAPLLFGLVALNIPIFVIAIVQGRWSPMLRKTSSALSLVLCAVMAWVALGGPVFMAAAGDQVFRFFLLLLVVVTLVDVAVKAHRQVRPAPN
jgi:hypothetical protein